MEKCNEKLPFEKVWQAAYQAVMCDKKIIADFSDEEIEFAIKTIAYLSSKIENSLMHKSQKASDFDLDNDFNECSQVQNTKCHEGYGDQCDGNKCNDVTDTKTRVDVEDLFASVADIFQDLIKNVPESELKWIKDYLADIVKKDDDDEAMDYVKDSVIKDTLEKLLNGEEIELPEDIQAEIIDVLDKQCKNYRFTSFNNKCKLSVIE